MQPFSVVIPVSQEMTAHRRTLLYWIVDRYRAFWNINELKIIFGMDDSEPFNRARARNNGLAQVETEYVLIADGDTAFDPDAIQVGLDLLEEEASWVIPYGENDYYNLTQGYTESVIHDPASPFTDPVWDHRIKSWAGLLMARTKDCIIVGYDERFEGWGWEDVAFRIKMDAHIGKHARFNYGRALHLWHPRGDDEFNSPQEGKNRALFDREYRRPYRWRDERLR